MQATPYCWSEISPFLLIFGPLKRMCLDCSGYSFPLLKVSSAMSLSRMIPLLRLIFIEYTRCAFIPRFARVTKNMPASTSKISSMLTSPNFKFELWMNVGRFAPTIRVCTLTTALVERNSDHGNNDSHKTMVVVTNACPIRCQNFRCNTAIAHASEAP